MNIYLTNVSKFEFTPELNVFDAFGVSLYHGWIVDPQDQLTYSAFKDISYNQIISKIIHTRDPTMASSHSAIDLNEVRVLSDFLDTTANQLTFAGLMGLHEAIRNNTLCVFFRNNHFSTLLKRDDKLYLLVTDLGYADENSIVWELLDDISG